MKNIRGMLTLIMNLETSTTPDWYVYVGRGYLVCFFTANLRRVEGRGGGGGRHGGMRKGARGDAPRRRNKQEVEWKK